MIALTPLQQKLYETVKGFEGPITAQELRALLGWQTQDFRQRMKACLSKGYIVVDAAGVISACEPPHDRIMREVCTANGLSPSDVQGPSKTMKLARARRTIANRLQLTAYSFKDIGDVVNRHPSTVLDYLFPARAAERSQRRATERRQARASA
ncbi:MAG: Bacterial dnaA protein helix-turn-helix [Bradyrhizobium sp.]|nr:Bacterial dnaA protein helix-turn-helix [Bradyrhizobium sp.]